MENMENDKFSGKVAELSELTDEQLDLIRTIKWMCLRMEGKVVNDKSFSPYIHFKGYIDGNSLIQLCQRFDVFLYDGELHIGPQKEEV